jgi:hypothetical protein
MNIRGLLILTVALPGNTIEGPQRVGPEVIYRCGRLREGNSCGERNGVRLLSPSG